MDGPAFQDEVLTFVSYCDITPQAIRDLAIGLFRCGLIDLSRRFAHWLTSVDRDELVDKSGMEPAEAQAFLALSEGQPTRH